MPVGEDDDGDEDIVVWTRVGNNYASELGIKKAGATWTVKELNRMILYNNIVPDRQGRHLHTFHSGSTTSVREPWMPCAAGQGPLRHKRKGTIQ